MFRNNFFLGKKILNLNHLFYHFISVRHINYLIELISVLSLKKRIKHVNHIHFQRIQKIGDSSNIFSLPSWLWQLGWLNRVACELKNELHAHQINQSCRYYVISDISWSFFVFLWLLPFTRKHSSYALEMYRLN